MNAKNAESRETTRKSIGWAKIGGIWFEEVAKRMIGVRVIAIQVRDGRWFDISQVECR